MSSPFISSLVPNFLVASEFIVYILWIILDYGIVNHTRLWYCVSYSTMVLWIILDYGIVYHTRLWYCVSYSTMVLCIILDYGIVYHTWLWFCGTYLIMVLCIILDYGIVYHTWLWYCVSYLTIVLWNILDYGFVEHTWLWFCGTYLTMVLWNILDYVCKDFVTPVRKNIWSTDVSIAIQQCIKHWNWSQLKYYNTEKQRREHFENTGIRKWGKVGVEKSTKFKRASKSPVIDGHRQKAVWYDSNISLGYRFLCWSKTVACTPYMLRYRRRR